MIRTLTVTFLGWSLLSTVLPSFAQEGIPQPVEVTTTERIKFPPGGAIRLNGSYGYLSVDGWDEPEVQITIIKSTDRFYKPNEQEEAKRRLDLIQVVTERRSETELAITTTLPSRHGTWAPPLPANTKAGVTLEYRLNVPRDSRLEIHHDIGYVWVSGVAGDIEATSHTGDMVVMLPGPGPYSFDTRTGLGNITHDFLGDALKQLVVGARFVRAGVGPSRRVYLRMGRGNITIRQLPPV